MDTLERNLLLGIFRSSGHASSFARHPSPPKAKSRAIPARALTSLILALSKLLGLQHQAVVGAGPDI